MPTHCYINRQSRKLQIWVILILRVLEALSDTQNMGTHDIPDLWPATLLLPPCISGKSLVPMLQLLHKIKSVHMQNM